MSYARDLFRFYEENTFGPDWSDMSDGAMGLRLIFAARLAKGDPTLPRTLEAHRVVWAVPEAVGMRWVAAREANEPCPACPLPDDRPKCCHDGDLS